MPKMTAETTVVQISLRPIRAMIGAPVLARMGSKLIWTTIISAVIFAISLWAYYQGYFNIERLAKLMGMPF